MAISPERFAQGLTYEAYRAQMNRNQERFLENEAAVTFNQDDLAFFQTLAEPLNIVAIGEDWCGDVIANLPVLGQLVEQSPQLALRIFLRDENLDLMDQYLKEGKYRSIPVFVIFDQDFNELGHWIERPAKMTAMQAELRTNLFATEPLLAGIDPETPIGQMPEAARNQLMAAFGAFRQEQRDFSNQEVVRELRALVEDGTVQQQPQQPTTQSAVNGANGAASTTATPTTATPTTAVTSANGRVKVSITYCADCGYEPQTLGLTEALMKTFIHDLGGIELIPWQDGAFDVVVNGDLIHSMYRDGGFPAHEAVIDAVRARMPHNDTARARMP